jgi:hypothetical protein
MTARGTSLPERIHGICGRYKVVSCRLERVVKRKKMTQPGHEALLIMGRIPALLFQIPDVNTCKIQQWLMQDMGISWSLCRYHNLLGMSDRSAQDPGWWNWRTFSNARFVVGWQEKNKEERLMAWKLSGELIETCSCNMLCPCWFGQADLMLMDQGAPHRFCFASVRASSKE